VEQDNKTMVDALCALEDGLTAWEAEFVDSVSKQDPDRLSDKQVAIITRLYEKHC